MLCARVVGGAAMPVRVVTSRQDSDEILAAQTYPGVCAHPRIPYPYGDVHLHHVRHTDVPGMGRLERHGACVLDNHTYYHYRRRDPFVYLRSAHMVLVLSDGNVVILGDSTQRQTSRQLQPHYGE